MRYVRVLLGLGLAVLPWVSGCKPDAAAIRESEKVSGPLDEATKRQMAEEAAKIGGVTGVVRFVGKAPERVKIDMTMDPVCEMKAGDNYSEQYVVKDGKLANVYVYVKNGPEAAMSAGPTNYEPAVMDQKGCRYTPHVVAVMQGGTVEWRNSDPTMHNIHTMPTTVGNETYDVSQGPGVVPEGRKFTAPELMIPVRCNNHPWMNAFVNVSPTPFFAVTGEDGSFKILGLPPGTYTLGAVHEKLGEQTMQVTVKSHETGKAEFNFRMK